MKSIWFSLSLILMAIQLSAVCVSIGTAAEVTLLWNANDEADLDGYSIYQSTDSSGSPYDWIDDMFLDELADPDKPEAVVTQLEDGKKYYFVVTAFDKYSNESSVSNEICVKIEGSYAVDCSIEDSPEPPEDSPEPPEDSPEPPEDSPKSDSGDGGGGGGG